MNAVISTKCTSCAFQPLSKTVFTEALFIFILFIYFFNFGLDLMAENVFLFPRAQNTVLGPDRHEANLQ